MMKRLCALLLALVTVLGASGMVSAASAEILKTEYEGFGVVEVDLAVKVQYKNPKVIVTDPEGNKLTAVITDKDSDDIDFKVTGLKPDTKYTYKIKGIREKGTTTWTTFKGSFKTPKTELFIEKVKYDAKDKELDVDFFTRVQFKDAKVTLKDASGKKIKCTIEELGRDDMELKVKGLQSGKKYTLKVSGVRLYKTGKYTTVSKTFKVK